MEHILIPLGEIHRPHNWEYADQTAREAATPDASEVGLVALQLDDGSLWHLTGTGPTTWSRIGGGSSIALGAGTQTGTSGTVVFANSNGLTFGMSGSSQITASHNGITSQSVQTQSIIQQATLGGNTAGLMAAISSGTVLLAGGNNITLSQNGNSVTISGPNAVAQTNQSLGLYGSSQTYGQSSSSTVDARSLTIVGSGDVSVGMSGGSLLISGATQTIQTQSRFNASLSGNTEGVLALVSSGVMTLAGGSNVTLSQNGNAITIRAADAANAGLAAVGAGTQTATSGTAVFANSNGISFGMSGSSQITASYTVPTQTNQSVGIYGSSQTYGQSSSSTVDARSLTVVGSGGVSVGMSGGSLLISGQTTVAQSLQTQSRFNATLDGNTAGALALISSGVMTLAGGNNVTLSQNGNAVTISGPNTVAQTNQSIGVYGSSQTYGQSSSSTVDARSLTIVGSGGVSVGMSGGSVLISGQTTAAQTNQSVGIYGSSQTYGQSSSSTVDARSLTIVGSGRCVCGHVGGLAAYQRRDTDRTDTESFQRHVERQHCRRDGVGEQRCIDTCWWQQHHVEPETATPLRSAARTLAARRPVSVVSTLVHRLRLLAHCRLLTATVSRLACQAVRFLRRRTTDSQHRPFRRKADSTPRSTATLPACSRSLAAVY